MPLPLEILIDFGDSPFYEVPPSDPYREILVSAQKGDYIHAEGPHRYGNIVEKSLFRFPDPRWVLFLKVLKPPTAAHIEKLLKKPA